MTSNNSYITTIDPINALIEYINDIKPYHTKIVESNVSYVTSESANISTIESLTMLWTMAVANSTNSSFDVVGDETQNLSVNTSITIVGSAGNDGVYTVSAIVYNMPNTTISVVETVPVSGNTAGTLSYTNEIV